MTATNQLVGARQGDANVTLECHCESFPKPVVYWLKHGTQDVVVSGEICSDHEISPLPSTRHGSVRKVASVSNVLFEGACYFCTAGGKYREEKRETNHYKVTMQLTFLQLEREDFMAYQCVCRNTLGLAESVVRLYRESLAFFS